MNALALWIPGTLLFIAGFVLLATGQLSFNAGLAIAMVGVVLESAGILLWLRQRRTVKKG